MVVHRRGGGVGDVSVEQRRISFVYGLFEVFLVCVAGDVKETRGKGL